MKHEEQPMHDDPLLRDLRQLPMLSEPSEAPRAARAAFIREFVDLPWHERAFLTLRPLAFRTALACFVFLYMSWAFSAAFAMNR